MTHNAKFSQKSGLDWLKQPILVILQVFPHNEAQIHSEWPFSCNSQLFLSSATKASHFIWNLKNLHFWGGRYISKFFEFFNFLDSFHTKLAKNDPQWQILPKKSVILAQNGQFWSFCRFFPIISHNSLSFSTSLIPFTPNWLKMTHNAKFCQKSGLDWLKMVVHWDIYIFISFTCSIQLFGLILTSSEKVSPVLKVSCRSIDIVLRYLCFCKFWS